jgi:hypothetical protein
MRQSLVGSLAVQSIVEEGEDWGEGDSLVDLAPIRLRAEDKLSLPQAGAYFWP